MQPPVTLTVRVRQGVVILSEFTVNVLPSAALNDLRSLWEVEQILNRITDHR